LRRGTDYLIEALCWIALLHSFFIAFIATESIIILVTPVPVNDPGTVQKLHDVLTSYLPDLFDAWVVPLLSVMAVMSFLIGLFFLSKIIVMRRERRRIVHSTPRGRIQISLVAVRSFIERVLVSEFGLEKFRVFLRQTGAGLEVRVRAIVPVGRNVLQTGEQMQKIVQQGVEEKLGVKIKGVEIIAQGVAAEGESEAEPDARLYASGDELD
jgi:uncharacterized alkaline shock family protein YloU